MSIEERLGKLEKRFSRQRRFSYIKTLVYMVIIAGVALYGYRLYASMDDWKVEPYGAPRAWFKTPRVLSVDMYLRIHNPDGEVSAKLVYYRVYIQGEYAGDGLIPYLKIPSGTSVQKVPVELDLSRVGCGVARALVGEENLTLRVTGYAMVDLKTWGGLTWKTITLPFNFTIANLEMPDMSDTTKGFLILYSYVCTHPNDIIGIINGIATENRFPLMNISLPGQSQGQSQSSDMGKSLNITVESKRVGLLSYELTIILANTGDETITIQRILLDSIELYKGPTKLGPSESITLTTKINQIYKGTHNLVVQTDKGKYEESVNIG